MAFSFAGNLAPLPKTQGWSNLVLLCETEELGLGTRSGTRANEKCDLDLRFCISGPS